MVELPLNVHCLLFVVVVVFYRKYPMYNKQFIIFRSCAMGMIFHSHTCIFTNLRLVEIHLLVKYLPILYTDSKYYILEYPVSDQSSTCMTESTTGVALVMQLW